MDVSESDKQFSTASSESLFLRGFERHATAYGHGNCICLLGYQQMRVETGAAGDKGIHRLSGDIQDESISDGRLRTSSSAF